MIRLIKQNVLNQWKCKKIRRTGFTMIHHANETYEERVARMKHLFQQYLTIKDKIHKHTIDELDILLKERFKANVFDKPLPLSQFDDYGLSSLGEEEFVTEKDIVKIYQISDTTVLGALSEKEKKSLSYQEYLSEKDIINLYQLTDDKKIQELLAVDKEVKFSFYGDALSEEARKSSFCEYYDDMSKQEKKTMFSERYENISMEEKFSIYDKHLKRELEIKNVYIVLESKDSKSISGQTTHGGSFTELEAVLFITQCNPVPEVDFDIKDSWFQQYLEALVWGGWIEDKD